MKKILSVLLTALIILSVSYACFAAEKPVITVGSSGGKTGDIVEIAFSIKNNPGFAGGQMEIVYDKNDLELTGITLGNLPLNTEYNVNTGKIAFGSSSNNSANGTLFTAEFKILASLDKDCAVDLNIVELYNANDTDLNQTVVPGTVTVSNRVLQKGDINGDGSVNNKDVITLFRCVSTDETESYMDLDGDGTVGNKDVQKLFQYISKQTAII